MRINTNISSLNAWRNLSMTDGAMSKNLERLSSGYRINRAADDVAGLAISENMRAQITGLNQAVKNAQDGTSLLQTAEGSLNEVHTMLQRMRELAVQSANGTLQPEDRKQIQTEMDNLTKEVTRITNATQFNSKDLIDGSLQDGNIASVTLQIGPNGGQTVNFSIGAMDAKSLGISRDVLTGNVDNGAMQMAVRATGGGYTAGAQISAVTALGGGIDAAQAYRVSAASTSSLQLEKSNDGGVTWSKVGAAANTSALAAGASAVVGDTATGETLTVTLTPAGNSLTAGAIDMADFSGGANNGGMAMNVKAIGTAGAGLADAQYKVSYDSTTQKMQLMDMAGNNIGSAIDVSALKGKTVTLGDANTARTLDVTVKDNLAPAGTTVDTVTMSSSSGKVVDAKAVLASVKDSSNLLANGAYRVAFDNAAGGSIQLQDATGRAIGAAVAWAGNSDITIGDAKDGRTVTVHTVAGAGPALPAVATIQVTNNGESGETAQFTGGVKYANSRAFAGLNVSSVDGAQAAIAAIDNAIGKVSYQRSQLGAIQNRLDHTVNNLQVVSENLTASESRIRDVDMAMEMTQFTKHQILMQSGTAMLAQANQKNQAVLSLLR